MCWGDGSIVILGILLRTLYWWQARWVQLRCQLPYLLIINDYAFINPSYSESKTVMMLTLLLLVLQEVVIVTTYGSTGNDKGCILVTISFQWKCWSHICENWNWSLLFLQVPYHLILTGHQQVQRYLQLGPDFCWSSMTINYFEYMSIDLMACLKMHCEILQKLKNRVLSHHIMAYVLGCMIHAIAVVCIVFILEKHCEHVNSLANDLTNFA